MKSPYKVALVYPRLIHQLHGLWPPLGILGVAATIAGADTEVRLFDLTFNKKAEDVLGPLKSFGPDAVGIGYLTEFSPAVRTIARAASGELGAKVFLGGPHPTILPKQTLEQITDAVAVTIGEAEYTTKDLIQAFADGGNISHIKGIAYRDESNNVVINERAPFIQDLDALPFPARDELPTLPKYLKGRALNVHAIRGCPFKCEFCQPTLFNLFGKAIRHRSAKSVADEIEMLSTKYNLNEFFFVDDIFTLDKKLLAEVAQEFSSRKITPASRFVVNSRVDIFSEDVAELMVELNCYYILFGIESGSQEVLDSLGKGTTLAQARQAFSICKRKGLRTHAYVLLGSPAETKETLRATEELVMELNPDSVHISIYTPLPGTTLRQKCEHDGRLSWEDVEDLDYYTPTTLRRELPVRNENVTYDDVLSCRRRILRRRKSKLLLHNAKDLASDLVSKGGLSKAMFRYKLYRRMSHYFG